MTKNKIKSIFSEQRVILALVIAVVVVVVSIINPRFIALNNIIIIFQQISVLGIITMAMGLLMISGGTDISLAHIMVLCGITMSKLLQQGMPLAVALLVGLAVGALCGFVNGFIIAKTNSIPLIITLGTGQVYYGISLLLSGGTIQGFDGALDFLKYKIFGVIPVMLIVLFAVTAVTSFLLNRTKFGRRVVAVGGNPHNAYLCGINVVKYKIITWTIAGFLSAVASIVFCARIDSITANSSGSYSMNAMAAAIMGGITFAGGTGTISGAFLGCLMMGVINNAMNILKVPSFVQTIVSGAIIVAALIVSNFKASKKK
ncbi:MAG: ABC transporter permease [Candidatus Faecousia sp.]|nr:ABC transporter permease [Candidatus Faecousia sp.]